jgi:hypothetical protein
MTQKMVVTNVIKLNVTKIIEIVCDKNKEEKKW